MSRSRARVGHLRDPRLFAALGLGAGLSPWGPGTAGTLVGALLYLALQNGPEAVALAVTVAVVAGGIPLCGYAARRLAVHDDPAIVWDEIAGYLVTMILVPQGWPWMLAGFVLFRVFDILKPGPIGWFDRHLEGGLGIMVDDVLAGVAACGSLHLVRLAFALG